MNKSIQKDTSPNFGEYRMCQKEPLCMLFSLPILRKIQERGNDFMDEKELLKQSETLTEAWESMKVSIDSLSMIIALTRENKAWGNYYFGSRLADNLEASLLNISETMLAVSDAICPEED